MTRIVTGFTGAFLGMVISAAAQPTAPDGQFYPLGSGGSSSCEAFVAAAESNNRARRPDDPPNTFYHLELASLMSWIEGFVSAMNYMAPTGRMVGRHAAPVVRYLWVETYCRSHPLDTLVQVAAAFRRDLIARGM